MGFMPGAAFDAPFWPAADNSGEFEIKDILGHGSMHSGIKYLVKWLGYPVVEGTWEPLSHLTNCPDVFSAYEGGQRLRPTQKWGDIRFCILQSCFYELCLCHFYNSSNYYHH